MRGFFKGHTLTTGLAMFSMFFGAGNVMFPLLVGLDTGDQNGWAMVGLLSTAIVVPFLGLLSMVLYKGDYRTYFRRIGRVPGALVALLIMLVIGPFGGIPRCVALSFDTAALSFPALPQWLFTLVTCGVIFLFAFRESRIVDLLGRFLTPLLLVALLIIIVSGWIAHPAAMPSDFTSGSAFIEGLQVGYNTLDLMAAFFFSTVVLASLHRHAVEEGSSLEEREMVPVALRSSLIAGGLLGLIYLGMSYVAVFYGSQVEVADRSQLLAALALRLLGGGAGWIANVAVSLTCITTAIALSAVFADFVERVVFRNKVSYVACLLGTLLVTYVMSYLHFTGIVAVISPVAKACYPALITLAVCNLAYKVWGFKWVKTPVYVVFTITLLAYAGAAIWGS